MNLEKELAAYIESKKAAWSDSTLNSEKYRLTGVTIEMLEEPAKLFQYLNDERKLKPYPLKTAFIRAGEFVDFLMARKKFKEGLNPVKQYMKDEARKFKHAYTKKEVGMTFEEAARRINTLEDEALRTKALQLLYTGMRYSESLTLANGSVLGKGGWRREVPMANETPTDFDSSYHTLYRALKPLGLTAHMLRKLCATKLVELGATEADLMKIMGWRSSAMAAMYVQAAKQKKVTEALTSHLRNMEQRQRQQGAKNTDGKQIPGSVQKANKRRSAASRKSNAR